jgi:heat shock protein HslJ
MPCRTLLPVLAIVAALTISGCNTPRVSGKVAGAAAAPLVNTQWRLTQLGGQLVANSEGASAVTLRLEPQNPRITGFGGCNRMFGGYLLNGEQLKFDQVGATKMACLDAGRMKLEDGYFQMLARVTGWKIDGATLSLLDADGTALARFAATLADTPSGQ